MGACVSKSPVESSAERCEPCTGRSTCAAAATPVTAAAAAKAEAVQPAACFLEQQAADACAAASHGDSSNTAAPIAAVAAATGEAAAAAATIEHGTGAAAQQIPAVDIGGCSACPSEVMRKVSTYCCVLLGLTQGNEMDHRNVQC